MKNTFKLGVTLIALSLVLVGCSSGTDKEKDIDMGATAAEMMEATDFEFDLVAVGDSLVDKYYDLADVDSFVVYLEPSGASAEEISIFKAKDSASASNVASMLKDRIQSRIAEYENYVPSEVLKLNSATVRQNGSYVTLIVASEPAPAESAFDKAFS